MIHATIARPEAPATVNWPNFVIAGAPKCGTTALYEYLRTHPQVYLPVPKEPQYFADDVGRHREVTRRDDYQQLYEKPSPQHRAIGDASPWYMHSSVAMQRLRNELSSDLKIILSLRSPVDFIASLHSDLLWTCFEDEADLARAWELQEVRHQGQLLPATCLVPWFLQYRNLARFSVHVEKVLALFPREQVKVILLDDLKQAPQATYHDILRFLELQPDTRAEFSQVNPASRNRLAWLARWQTAMQYALPEPAIRFGKRLGLGLVNRALKRANTARRPRTELPEKLRRRMLAELASDIDALSELIGRDLSAWKQ